MFMNQDDDVRVPCGKAHDHAREIVEEHQALTKLVEAIKGNILIGRQKNCLRRNTNRLKRQWKCGIVGEK
jgi:hypothetical protein